eukprot:764305_1
MSSIVLGRCSRSFESHALRDEDLEVSESLQADRDVMKQLAYTRRAAWFNSRDHDERTRSAIRKVMACMSTHPSDRLVQRYGCRMLSNVAVCAANCELIQEARALPVLRNAMRAHMDDWEMQWLACSALWNIARPDCTRASRGEP